jgi:hypothetical protein
MELAVLAPPAICAAVSADASQLSLQDLHAFCSSCVCAVGTANLLGFEAAGVLLQGQRVSQLAAVDYPAAVGAVSMLANTCSAVLGSKVGTTHLGPTSLAACSIGLIRQHESSCMLCPDYYTLASMYGSGCWHHMKRTIIHQSQPGLQILQLMQQRVLSELPQAVCTRCAFCCAVAGVWCPHPASPV